MKYGRHQSARISQVHYYSYSSVLSSVCSLCCDSGGIGDDVSGDDSFPGLDSLKRPMLKRSARERRTM